MANRADDRPAASGRASLPASRELTPAATILFGPDPALLEAQLEALGRNGRRLYIIANGPLDAAVETLLARLDDPAVIRLPANLGQGAALNLAMERARDDGHSHLLLMDQDSTPDPDLPEALQGFLAAGEARGGPIAAVAPLLSPPAGQDYLPVRYAWRHKEAGTVDFAPTSGSLVSIAAWSAIGPFRADYFVDGIDVEWGLRAWSRGYRSLIARDLSMVHRWGVAAGTGHRPQILRQPDARNYYYIRNATHGLRLAHFPPAWKLRAAGTLAAQILLLLGQRRFDRATRSLVAGALRDGLAGRLGPLDPALPVSGRPAPAGSP